MKCGFQQLFFFDFISVWNNRNYLKNNKKINLIIKSFFFRFFYVHFFIIPIIPTAGLVWFGLVICTVYKKFNVKSIIQLKYSILHLRGYINEKLFC